MRTRVTRTNLFVGGITLVVYLVVCRGELSSEGCGDTSNCEGSRIKRVLGFPCSGTSDCSDGSAVCIGTTPRCTCNPATYYSTNRQAPGGECKANLGFDCKHTEDCADTGAYCTIAGSKCACNESTHYDTNGSASGGDCLTDGPLGSQCPFDNACSTSHSICRGNTCICEQGYEEKDMECKVDLGFPCTTGSDCTDVSALCLGSPLVCICNDTTHYDTNGVAKGGGCEAKSLLGSQCVTTDACVTSHSACVGNICVCENTYVTVGLECKTDLGFPCVTGSDCADVSAVCTGSPHVCTCNDTTHYDTNKASTGGDCKTNLGFPCNSSHSCADVGAVCSGSPVSDCICNAGTHYDSNGQDSGGHCIEIQSEPKDFKVGEISINDITITWQSPDNLNSGDVLGFIVQIKLSDNTRVQEIIYRCSDCAVSFQIEQYDDICASHVRSVHWRKGGDLLLQQTYRASNLLPAMQYTIYISLVTLAGRGKLAEYVVTTLQEAPRKPFNVTVVDVSPTSIRIFWTIIGQDLDTTVYVISIIPAPPIPPRNITVEASRRSITVTELEENWPYSISVSAENERGSARSDRLVSHLTFPSAPGPVSVFSATTAPDGNYDQVLVHWKSPSVLDRNSRITHYVFNPGASDDVYAVNEENEDGEVSRLEVSAPKEEADLKTPLVAVGVVLGTLTVTMAIGLTVTLVKYVALRRIVTGGISSAAASPGVNLTNIEAQSTLDKTYQKDPSAAVRL